jgi:hypothetical protein
MIGRNMTAPLLMLSPSSILPPLLVALSFLQGKIRRKF